MFEALISPLGRPRTHQPLPSTDPEQDMPADGAASSVRSYGVGWAQSQDEVREAQRLRHRVFVQEMGARPEMPPGTPAGHEADRFDHHCAHLLIRSSGGDDDDGRLIACCRVLLPQAAEQAGGCYTEKEFDLGPLRTRLPEVMELGRVCIDRRWRNGLVVLAMWREIGDLMQRERALALIGCTSIDLSDGGKLARALWQQLHPAYLVNKGHRARPWVPLSLDGEADVEVATVPALMKGYLRCGGRLLGPPAIDAAFGTADFPMMVKLSDMPQRYARRILR